MSPGDEEPLTRNSPTNGDPGKDAGPGDQARGERVVLPAETILPEEDVEDVLARDNERDEVKGEGEGALAEEPAGEETDVQVLQQELALLETQLQNMRDRYIRAVADLDNARKRARRAIGDARKQAVSGVLLELLGLVDNFERALETVQPGSNAPPETRAVYEGVGLIYRQLMTLVEQRGVRPIQAVGRPFDPSQHEAVAQIAAAEGQREGIVALEIRKGYLYGEEVLRHTRVGVTVHQPEEEPREPD